MFGWEAPPYHPKFMGGSRGAWDRQHVLAELERLALRAPARAVFFDEAAVRLFRSTAPAGTRSIRART